MRRLDLYIALALFCLLMGLYGLTTGAYIDSTDGETMYLVAESLIERGTLVQLEPEQAGDAPRTVTRAPNGKLYSITGPLQSLLSLPFYIVGRWVARAFPPAFYFYFTRFFVSLFNGAVSAATGALLYLLGMDLGYRRRTALFVALTYSMATTAWPYARTYFAEPLHTFWIIGTIACLYRYRRTGHGIWMALGGLAIGLGVATKYVMAITGPVFALYLLFILGRQPAGSQRWRWLWRTVLYGAVPFALIIASLMVFNVARFGDVWETGYTQYDMRGPVQTWQNISHPLISWYGFFFSAGKGLFFFSPPAILALWGWPALTRRRREESWLLLTLALVHPLFYSLITWDWFGGINWGPRYIVCITPLLILPLGAFLERRDIARAWRYVSALFLFVLGSWGQLSNSFVNYNQYLLSAKAVVPDVRFRDQLYYPPASPLAAQWQLWPDQGTLWQRYDHDLRTSDSQFYTLEGDLYNVEVPAMAPWGRWMGESLRLHLYARPKHTLTIRISYSRPHAMDRAGNDASRADLHWTYDRARWDANHGWRGNRQVITETAQETQWLETLTIPAEDVQIFPGTLVITTTPWIPYELGDDRTLGVFIADLDVLVDEHSPQEALALPWVEEVHLPRPMPLSPTHPWCWDVMAWFFDPTVARPLDMWPWHIWISGVPLTRARWLIASLLGIQIGFLLAGLVGLILLVQRDRDG